MSTNIEVRNIIVGSGGTPASSVVTETTYGQSSAVGVGTAYARDDHTHGTPALPTKSQVGLGNVDNTSDVNKPVSTAQATADTNTLNTAKSYADGLVVGLLDDRGNYSASGNVFPSSGGSGTAGAILKGDLWTISVAGTLGGVVVTAGDVVRCLVDTPGQTSTNWAISENNIGYVAENQANKDNTTTLGTSTILYPTQNAVKVYVDNQVATKQPVDAGLTSISALTGAGYVKATATDTFSQVTTIPNTDITGLGTLSTQNGTFSGTSSGTNTGDQTITLTGDITGSGTGSFATTIGALKVLGSMIANTTIDLTTKVTGLLPFANIANVATSTVMYRKTAATGPIEAQTLTTLKTDLGLTGTNSGDQTSIVGITGTLAQFNTAVTDADLARTDAANTFTGVQTFSTPIASASVATMTATVGGGVPTPPNNTTTFLRGDGTFATPSGGGDMILASAQTNSGLKTFLDATFGLRNVANTFTSIFTNTNTASRTYTLPDVSGTLVTGGGTASGTNTGDNATNSQYSGLVSNATHTGDATGATALTLATVNANVGSFGLAGSVSQFVVNAKGLITSAVNVAISITASQVSDFSAGVRAVTLTGLSLATSQVIASTDTVLLALGYLQAQITALTTTVSGKQNTITLTTTGTSGASTLIGATLNIPNYASGGGSGITRSISSISTNTSAGATAVTDYVYLCTATLTITLPTAVGNTNRYAIKNVGGTTTIATTSSQTIDGSTTATLSVQYVTVEVVSDGANWNII